MKSLEIDTSEVTISTLRDPKFLLQIVLKCVEKSCKRTILIIKHFRITDQADLIEIAKACAEKDPAATACFIRNFGITDPKTLLDIAKICANRNGKATLAHAFTAINPYDWIFEIVPLCIIQNPNLFSECVLSVSMDEINRRFPNCGFDWVAEYPNPRAQLTTAIITSLTILRLKLTDEQLKFGNQYGIFQAIFELRSPHQCMFYIEELSAALPRMVEQGIPLPEICFAGSAKKIAPLLNAALAYLQLQGVEIRTCVEFCNENRKSLKDTIKLKMFLLLLWRLAASAKLNCEQKTNLLRTFNSQEKINQASLLFEFGLEDQRWDDRLLRTLLKKLGIGEMQEDFVTRFMETFGSSRDPDAILRYWRKIDSLGDPAAAQCLGSFIQSVVNGTLHERRYDLTQSPHLKKLEEIRPGIISRWRETVSFLPQEADLSVAETEDPHDLLLCGLEARSCLCIDGNPSSNRGLLGYLMHGQIHLLAVKDLSGKICGRALLRLVIIGRDRPALLLERFYGNHECYKKQIIALAKNKAEKMELPLFILRGSSDSFLSQIFPPEGREELDRNAFHCLGGPAPWEQVDFLFSDCYEYDGSMIIAHGRF